MENRAKFVGNALNERLDHVNWMISHVEDLHSVPLNSGILVLRNIDEARYKYNNDGSRVDFNALDEEGKANFLRGVRLYTERVFTDRIVHILDDVSMDNRDYCINMTDDDGDDPTLPNIEKLLAEPIDEIRPEFNAGKKQGIQNVLTFLEGTVPLFFYTRDLLEKMDLGRVDADNGARFRLQTCVPGIRVDYFFPDQGLGNTDQQSVGQTAPSISLLVDRL